jgi:hypothetical protein
MPVARQEFVAPQVPLACLFTTAQLNAFQLEIQVAHHSIHGRRILLRPINAVV